MRGKGYRELLETVVARGLTGFDQQLNGKDGDDCTNEKKNGTVGIAAHLECTGEGENASSHGGGTQIEDSSTNRTWSEQIR